jgi:hypothetical protein
LQGPVFILAEGNHIAILVALSDHSRHSLLEFSATLLKLSEDFLFDLLTHFFVLVARLGLNFSLLLCCFTILGPLFNEKNLLFFSTLASL